MSKTIEDILFLRDSRNNVTCVPPTPENLKKMARELGLKTSWMKDRNHFKVPEDVEIDSLEEVSEVSTTTLFRSIHNIGI